MGRGVARSDPTHVTLKVKLCMKFVATEVCLTKVPSMAFFWLDMKAKMGVVI